MTHIHLRLKAVYDARSRARAGGPASAIRFSFSPIFNGLSTVLMLALALQGRG